MTLKTRGLRASSWRLTRKVSVPLVSRSATNSNKHAAERVLVVKFDERALGGTSDESGEADGEKARGTQMGLPRVCTVRERAGMVVGLSSYG